MQNLYVRRNLRRNEVLFRILNLLLGTDYPQIAAAVEHQKRLFCRTGFQNVQNLVHRNKRRNDFIKRMIQLIQLRVLESQKLLQSHRVLGVFVGPTSFKNTIQIEAVTGKIHEYSIIRPRGLAQSLEFAEEIRFRRRPAVRKTRFIRHRDDIFRWDSIHQKNVTNQPHIVLSRSISINFRRTRDSNKNSITIFRNRRRKRGATFGNRRRTVIGIRRILRINEPRKEHKKTENSYYTNTILNFSFPARRWSCAPRLLQSL